MFIEIERIRDAIQNVVRIIGILVVSKRSFLKSILQTRPFRPLKRSSDLFIERLRFFLVMPLSLVQIGKFFTNKLVISGLLIAVPLTGGDLFS